MDLNDDMVWQRKFQVLEIDKCFNAFMSLILCVRKVTLI